MRELIHDKIVKEQLLAFFGESLETGTVSPSTERLVKNYLQDSVAEVILLRGSGGITDEELKKYCLDVVDKTIDNIIEAFSKNSDFKDSLYKESYNRLKALGDGSNSYGDLFTEIYQDETYLNEIFVRLVEETEGVAITSAKQLQELTGIAEIYGYADEETGELKPYGDKKPTKKEAQEIAFKQIEEAFISAMSYRYSKALEDILEAGGKYNDLLQVKPSYFNLPETWSGCLPTAQYSSILCKDQYSSILWAIEETFLIGEPNTSVRPDLKTIAQEIEAPYSVLMDIHKLCNIHS